ncbi:Flavin-dependent oxidoreductase, luciferase family (includes alkanesulfonate monooxygenase SsuD and methylene tetrahydromethanopterin reductase) [Paractinoplanes atraurantiacus]|uniref:Flavin-dependent oxidoreductase, luciferase family (Includes alkanesulfonate monooxygenase SsuD and methylene tetrahydromethanopterin reductase) n=2 Tax=Paractinoplanes atraurantiacus TaxID=1036182 RepID=A0A285KPP8_9ACTN|nr:Flavin-dependent oxidoreductase, luciferase family (includes alkanesulfonate monooxygenase SsuD and methylene tetrahydromethanopterin reductase) [Actinoplanes atraurantiacus]
MFDRDRQPEELTGFATDLERLGADDLWVIEDLGWTGSISSAALALAATSHLRVGIGIAPVALRNPALLAMELGNLARVHEGRLVAGVGHGVPDWMRKVGAERTRKLALLEETIVGARGLLAGETVTLHGQEVTLDGISLVHPPRVVPPIVTGVVKPKSLELSGRVADGTILAEGAGPAEIAAALAHIGKGRAAGDRPAHELIVFTYLRTDDFEVTREMVEGQAAWLGVDPSEVFSLIGPAEEIPGKIESLRAAGADTIVLRPLGPDPLSQVRTAMRAIGPR